ncbi:MAG: hypothetical protein NUV56_01060 [Candidatus Uhrbacteria bacterium]|nr:hypothetical protein [Candidatus Uhrbacteria bacterium]
MFVVYIFVVLGTIGSLVYGLTTVFLGLLGISDSNRTGYPSGAVHDDELAPPTSMSDRVLNSAFAILLGLFATFIVVCSGFWGVAFIDSAFHTFLSWRPHFDWTVVWVTFAIGSAVFAVVRHWRRQTE